MLIAFELSMPRNNSWDHRWSGDGRCYVILKTFSSKKAKAHAAELIAKRAFYYNWPDGWTACISVREVDSAEARKLRKKSNGFCGYDWMVASILQYGAIYADHEIPKAALAPAGATK